jgi:fumarylacetoacetase
MKHAPSLSFESMIDATHDPSLTSWVSSANDPNDFPVQNLPLGIYSTDADTRSRIGVAIGDQVLDLGGCIDLGLIDAGESAETCRGATLNELMGLGRPQMKSLRGELSEILRDDTERGIAASRRRDEILTPAAQAHMRLPAAIGDYTDFYASLHHATNVGRMFRPDNPLLPNYKYVPIGYHGRASSILPSGTAVRRPLGQTKAADAESPSFGPSRMLDYESELGFFVARGNRIGEVIPIDESRDNIFGFCLVNDWSARDIQAWEYQPLGPFLAKNFGTTISPWIVTADAVDPYRIAAPEREAGDPAPLEYLASEGESKSGAINAFLEVYIASQKMRDEGVAPMLLSRAAFALMYWTVGQMLTHHASNGCNLRPGDLLASGTVSGANDDSRGCLLELTSRGAKPLTLPTGEERKFLRDGDEVIMKGYLEAEGRVRIGFGECRGVILPANEPQHRTG